MGVRFRLIAAILMAASAAQAGDDHARMRDQSRALVHRSCGECHDGGRSTAVPKALKVFDSREVEWTAHMSDSQLHKASGRLAGLKPEARPSAAEKAAFDAFVSAELARRHAD
jgi:hypothetical protein